MAFCKAKGADSIDEVDFGPLTCQVPTAFWIPTAAACHLCPVLMQQSHGAAGAWGGCICWSIKKCHRPADIVLAHYISEVLSLTSPVADLVMRLWHLANMLMLLG